MCVCTASKLQGFKEHTQNQLGHYQTIPLNGAEAEAKAEAKAEAEVQAVHSNLTNKK